MRIVALQNYAKHKQKSQTTHRTAASTHIHLSVALGHDNAIVVGTVRTSRTFLSALDLNVGDVFPFVGQRPQLPDNFVDVRYFHPVILIKRINEEKKCRISQLGEFIGAMGTTDSRFHYLHGGGLCPERRSTCQGR